MTIRFKFNLFHKYHILAFLKELQVRFLSWFFCFALVFCFGVQNLKAQEKKLGQQGKPVIPVKSLPASASGSVKTTSKSVSSPVKTTLRQASKPVSGPVKTAPGSASSAVKTAPIPASGQAKGTPIQLKSITGETVIRGGRKVFLMKGDCHFSQGSTNMSSDSAYSYTEENSLDAFGHVVIHQADTLTITGDKLYYNGNTRKAQLFNHCVMTDRQGVLTTNHLDYDMATKIGTYYDGGRITNLDNILVSRTGYYYEGTKVAYFKSDVTILTPTSTIKSDTLQYNTISHIAYFFGPTRITSKDDFIYCENGEYNTATDQARFSKNAYYTSGSKKLQGDSLYYDKRAGYGRAIKRVTFTDSLDNEILKGGYAQYNKASDETLVTRKPLLIFLTSSDEPVDSSKRKDSITRADSLKLVKNGSALGIKKNTNVLKEHHPSYSEILAGQAEEFPAGSPLGNPKHEPIPDFSRKKKLQLLKPVKLRAKMDSIFLTADTFRTIMVSGDLARPKLAPKYSVKKRIKPTSRDTLNKKATQLLNKIHADVIADSIAAKRGLPLPSKIKKSDTSSAKKVLPGIIKVPVKIDSSVNKLKKIKKKEGFFSRLFGANQGGSQLKPIIDSTSATARKIKARKDSIARREADAEAIRNIPDLLSGTPKMLKRGYRQLKPADTAHYRVIYAFHHARLYKSDFQAAADSMVYTYIDSTIRCFIRPALWTQGTQMTGDTISIRLKNRKLDSLIMIRSSFIISRVDSLENQNKFNQISGRDIFGKFINNKLNRMRVEGNGKSLFYANEEKTDSLSKKKISSLTGLNSEICSYFIISFNGNKAKRITAVDEPQGHFYPVSKIPAGGERLSGFLWRDSERPKSREDLFKRPTILELKVDAEINKKTAADSSRDVYSVNILDEPKPKVKKVPKKAAGQALKGSTGDKSLKSPSEKPGSEKSDSGKPDSGKPDSEKSNVEKPHSAKKDSAKSDFKLTDSLQGNSINKAKQKEIDSSTKRLIITAP